MVVFMCGTFTDVGLKVFLVVSVGYVHFWLCSFIEALMLVGEYFDETMFAVSSSLLCKDPLPLAYGSRLFFLPP